MADVKISGLPASTTPLAGTEVLPIVQGTTTKQVSVANLTAGRAVSAGSMGVGTTTIPNPLTVQLTTAATTGIQDVAYIYASSTGSADATFGSRLLFTTQNTNGNIWKAGIAATNSAGGSNLSDLTFYTAAVGNTMTEKMRIYSSGGVSIGNTTDPGAGNLSVTSTASAAKMDIKSIAAGAPALGSGSGPFSIAPAAFGMWMGVDGAGNSWWQATRTDSAVSYPILLNPNGGGVAIGSSVAPGTNNLSVAGTVATNGVKFPATQVPSADGNTLDDYEEGNWTPADTSGAGLTFTFRSATYTKIGRLVYINLYIIYPVTANASNAQISGLPFTTIASNAGFATGFVYGDAAVGMYVQTNGNATSLGFAKATDNATVKNSDLSGKVVIVDFSYQTA